MTQTKEHEVMNFPWQSMHGCKGNKNWESPRLVTKCEESNRPDQQSNMPSSEFLDTEQVLQEKVELVVSLLLKSRWTTAYTGAGISRSSGIGDYASKKISSIIQGPKLKTSLDARPSLSHCALTSLEKKGLLNDWVQQNHDGLPQKAGFPQEKLNEIHGAWFDPSNPVVKFGGYLRNDLFQWMEEIEKKVDLCLCLGTSLSGMNADRIAEVPCNRMKKGTSLGTVIVNLQRTKLDSKSCVRIWAPIDEVFRRLSKILDLELNENPQPVNLTFDRVLVPYTSQGKLDKTGKKMLLDFRPGKTLKIIKKESCRAGWRMEVRKKKDDGNYSVTVFEPNTEHFNNCMLGGWWLERAREGKLDELWFMNENPLFYEKDEQVSL